MTAKVWAYWLAMTATTLLVTGMITDFDPLALAGGCGFLVCAFWYIELRARTDDGER